MAAGNSNVQSGINYIDRIQKEWKGAQILYHGWVQLSPRTPPHTHPVTCSVCAPFPESAYGLAEKCTLPCRHPTHTLRLTGG